MTNSRRKGAVFERRIARDLRGWLPGSVIQRRRTDQQASAGEFDIDWGPGFPFAIECKDHKSFDAAQLWTRTGPLWTSWLAQAERQSLGADLVPLLVVNVPRRAVLALMPAAAEDALAVDHWSALMIVDSWACVLWGELLTVPPAQLPGVGERV